MFSEKRSNVLHGILLIALFSCSAFYIAEFPFVKNLSFSPLIVGILLGMVYANSLRNHLPETWVPGILFCTKQVLRAGIVLYGFRLTFQSVVEIDRWEGWNGPSAADSADRSALLPANRPGWGGARHRRLSYSDSRVAQRKARSSKALRYSGACPVAQCR